MKDSILSGALAMGLPVGEGEAALMAAYWQRLLAANQTLNLTRIVERQEACDAHFLDSLAPLLFGDLLPQGAAVADLGTGGGFPGVPLAIARPDLRFTLMDARQKRLSFVRGALDELGIPAATLHQRAEDASLRFDVVCARAVAPLSKLRTWALSLLRPGGRAILWKGPSVTEELTGSEELLSYAIPGRDWRRFLVVLTK